MHFGRFLHKEDLKQQFREHFLHTRSYALNGKPSSRNRVVVLVVVMHLWRAKCNAVLQGKMENFTDYYVFECLKDTDRVLHSWTRQPEELPKLLLHRV